MDIHEIRRAKLQQLRDERFKGKNSALAEAIERQPDYISRALSNGKHRKNIGEAFARHIETALGLESGWLDSEAMEEQSRPVPVVAAPELSGMVPVLSWIQAGPWTDSASAIDLSDVSYYPRPPGCSEQTYALRVQGESMVDKYPPGVLIFVDPAVEPVSGDDVIVQCEEHGGAEATFKRYIVEPGTGPLLKVLNRDWREQYMDLTPDCRIVGVVMAQMRMRGQ